MIITGGGRGIGAATARAAALRDYAVCVNYLRDEQAAELVVARIAAAGGRAVAVRGDVAVPQTSCTCSTRRSRPSVQSRRWSTRPALPGRITRFDALDLSTLRRVVDINLIGTMLCAQEAVRRFSTVRGGNGGSIVNLSSVCRRVGQPGRIRAPNT